MRHLEGLLGTRRLLLKGLLGTRRLLLEVHRVPPSLVEKNWENMQMQFFYKHVGLEVEGKT